MVIKGLYTIRLNSTRVPRKNIRLLGGRPLLNYALSTLNQVECIQDIILYSSSDLSEYIEPGLRYTWIQRNNRYDSDDTKFNDVLDSVIDRLDCDYIAFLLSTSPFIRPETIQEMIHGIEEGFDSAFTVIRHQHHAWYKGGALNYTPSALERTQGLEPVFIEGGALIISKDYYCKTGQRIGNKPYIKEIDILEGWDIDTPEEWRIAECLV